MPLSLVDFWKRLIQSGLVDSSKPRDWAASFATEHQSTPPSDPLTLAKWLVETGRMKDFQADCLLQDESRLAEKTGEESLRRFPVMRIAPLTQAAAMPPLPFSKWLPVAHDAYPDWPGVVLQIDPTGLTPADGDRLRWLAGVREVGIPQFELMALPGAPIGTRATSLPLATPLDAVGLFAPLPAGAMLSEKLKQEPAARWSATEILPLVESLATAMRGLMSGAGLTPPMPSPDRIWLPQSRSKPAMLWVDPVELLTPGVFQFARSIQSDESRWLYAAPETLDADDADMPANVSSFESQAVYALGCLAYRLRFGQHAFAAAEEAQIRSRQLRFHPPELQEAVTKGAAGDPLLRVLAYALSKDPGSRFASLDALLQAMRASSAVAAMPADSATPKTPAATPRPAVQEETKAVSQVDQPAKPAAAAKPVATPAAVAPAPAPAPAEKPVADRAVAAKAAQAKAWEEKPAATNPVAAIPVAEQNAVPSEPWPDQLREEVPRQEVAGEKVRRPSRRRTAWFVLGSLWIPIFLLIFALALQDPDAPRPVAKRTRPPIPAVIPAVTGSRSSTPSPASPRTVPPVAAPKNGIEVVSDDRMLWAPPSALADVDSEQQPHTTLPATSLLPPGPAALTTFDLRSLTATGLRATFDPEVSPLLEQLQKRIAVPMEDVRLIAMAWFPGRDGVPEIALAVHLETPRPLEQLTDAWEVSQAQIPGGGTLYAGDEVDADAYYPHFAASAAADAGAASEKWVDAFAVGSIARITQVAEVEGAAVLLPRQLEELWEAAQPSDAVAMLAMPNFLIADARTWVNQTAPTLRDWIRSTLTPECSGVLVRVAGGVDAQTSYLEVRLAAASGMDPMALKSKVLARIQSASRTAEDFLVSREIDPSWRLLASRLPTMWTFTGEQIRSAAIRREVIFNAYLPPNALPQLTLGTLLAANTTAMTVVATTASTTKKLTLDEMLDRPMTVSFGQESLQFAIDTIMTEFAAELPAGNQAPKVEIIGGDLQLMGITQNQQVRDFAKEKLPLRTVLTDLMLGANPDRTATGPNDAKQALIWVVMGEGDAAEIKVTTREAAKNKYKLPKEFVLP